MSSSKGLTRKDDPTKRHRLLFEPLGISCLVNHEDTIFAVAAEHDISIQSDCGGKGRCGKCLVVVYPADYLSSISDTESRLLTSEQLLSGQRLACQSEVNGPVTVSIASEDLECQEVSYKNHIQSDYSVDPSVQRLVVDAPAIYREHDDLCRDFVSLTAEKVRARTGKSIHLLEGAALRELSRCCQGSGPITLVCHVERGVTAVLHGDMSKSLGIAVDLGTTTVAAYLCDLRKGNVLSAAATTNPQNRYGEDVMSRIAFVKEQQSGTATLNELIVAAVNRLIRRCLEVVAAQSPDIDEVTVVGNSTMQHIFAGLSPRTLGYAPYLPVSCIIEDMRAADLGLELNPGTNVHFLPMISGFVGADTVGAILAERPHERDEITLIVDIGTNGELVLGNQHSLWASSCATGPAFEGAHISCGMRASAGAINQVAIDPFSHGVTYNVLGDSKSIRPRGICGSGTVDATAAMRRAGLLLPNGRLKESMPGVLSDERGIGREFLLVPPEDSATNQQISLSLEDIRQIQLAKAALSVGITLLMRRAGVERIDKLALTGAFGARFDWQNAVTIGMLPREAVAGQVSIVENAAGVGAVMALLDKKYRVVAQELSRRVRPVDLAKEPDFAKEFPLAMTFPTLGKT